MTLPMFLVPLMLLLAACGDGGPDSKGNNDTLFTGLSGVVIAAVVIYFVVKAVRNRDK